MVTSFDSFHIRGLSFIYNPEVGRLNMKWDGSFLLDLIPLTRDPANIVIEYCEPTQMALGYMTIINFHDGGVLHVEKEKIEFNKFKLIEFTLYGPDLDRLVGYVFGTYCMNKDGKHIPAHKIWTITFNGRYMYMKSTDGDCCVRVDYCGDKITVKKIKN